AGSRPSGWEPVRHLRAQGIVTAHRGGPSRLAADGRLEPRVGEAYSLFRAVEAVGAVQRSGVRVLDQRAGGVVAARLEVEESTLLVHLERLRLADEEPLAVDLVWLPAAVARPLLGVDFTRTSLYDELERHCAVRVSGGWERIRAVVPGRGELARLACWVPPLCSRSTGWGETPGSAPSSGGRRGPCRSFRDRRRVLRRRRLPARCSRSHLLTGPAHGPHVVHDRRLTCWLRRWGRGFRRRRGSAPGCRRLSTWPSRQAS